MMRLANLWKSIKIACGALAGALGLVVTLADFCELGPITRISAAFFGGACMSLEADQDVSIAKANYLGKTLEDYKRARAAVAGAIDDPAEREKADRYLKQGKVTEAETLLLALIQDQEDVYQQTKAIHDEIEARSSSEKANLRRELAEVQYLSSAGEALKSMLKANQESKPELNSDAWERIDQVSYITADWTSQLRALDALKHKASYYLDSNTSAELDSFSISIEETSSATKLADYYRVDESDAARQLTFRRDEEALRESGWVFNTAVPIVLDKLLDAAVVHFWELGDIKVAQGLLERAVSILDTLPLPINALVYGSVGAAEVNRLMTRVYYMQSTIREEQLAMSSSEGRDTLLRSLDADMQRTDVALKRWLRYASSDEVRKERRDLLESACSFARELDFAWGKSSDPPSQINEFCDEAVDTSGLELSLTSVEKYFELKNRYPVVIEEFVQLAGAVDPDVDVAINRQAPSTEFLAAEIQRYNDVLAFDGSMLQLQKDKISLLRTLGTYHSYSGDYLAARDIFQLARLETESLLAKRPGWHRMRGLHAVVLLDLARASQHLTGEDFIKTGEFQQAARIVAELRALGRRPPGLADLSRRISASIDNTPSDSGSIH